MAASSSSVVVVEAGKCRSAWTGVFEALRRFPGEEGRCVHPQAGREEKSADDCKLVASRPLPDPFVPSANAPAPSSGPSPCPTSPVPLLDAERRSPAGRPRTGRIALG